MPDISMCMSNACPKRMECYRYRAIPSEYRQSMFAPKPEGCTLFWPINADHRLSETPMAESIKESNDEAK